jgi:hypothetical protein
MKTLTAATALLVLTSGALAQQPDDPYSCRRYREAERKCAYNTIGKCVTQSEVDRLRQEYLRDGGRP